MSELGKPKGWSVEYGGEGTVGSHEGVSDVLGTPCLADTLPVGGEFMDNF